MTQIDGNINNAPIRQADIETVIKKPKYCNGRNPDKNSTRNPITTDNALNIIPLPVVINVIDIASS